MCGGNCGRVVAAALLELWRRQRGLRAGKAALLQRLRWRRRRVCGDRSVGMRQGRRSFSDCDGVGAGIVVMSALACGATAASAKQLWRQWRSTTAVAYTVVVSAHSINRCCIDRCCIDRCGIDRCCIDRRGIDRRSSWHLLLFHRWSWH